MSDDSWPESDWPRHVMGGALSRIRLAVGISIASSVAWLSFTLLYVAFWAHGFSLFQSIVVVLVSLLVPAGVLAVAWISFGVRWAHRVFD